MYHHLRSSDLSVFYIGKGTLKRAYTFSKRNHHWNNVKNKHGITVVIVATFLTEEEAYLEEEKQIKEAFNRGCKLTNKTLGGKPEIPLLETRIKMSKAAKYRVQPKRTQAWKNNLKKSATGRTHSQKTKDLISKKQTKICQQKGNQFITGKSQGKHTVATKLKLSRPVYCINNNTYYLSQKYAAESLGIHKGHINQVCKGTRNHTHGYKFQYVNTNT